MGQLLKRIAKSGVATLCFAFQLVSPLPLLLFCLFSTSTIRLCTGESFELTRAMLSVTAKTELVHTAKYTPNVIEPAFGVGRIFYSILEHTYYVRPGKEKAAAASSKPAGDDEDGRRTVFALPAHLAPTKLSILPISNKPELDKFSRELSQAAVRLGVSFKVDASAGSIGRRYARADEIGIPFGITSQFITHSRILAGSALVCSSVHVLIAFLRFSFFLCFVCPVDLQTPTDGRVTIRERDSMQQIRVNIADALPIVQQLTQGSITWQQAYDQNEKFTA